MDDSDRDSNPNPFLLQLAEWRRSQPTPADDHSAGPALLPPGPPAPQRPDDQPVEGYDPNKVYGLTRRFSLATLMLMMAATGLLLAAMNALRVPEYLTGAMIVLCIATAVGQMFLFGGKEPRQSSLIVGLVFCPLLAIVMLEAGAASSFRLPGAGEVIAMIFVGLLFGAPLGYGAGCIVAGVLLLMDLTESKFARWRKSREPDEELWPPPKTPRRDSHAEPRLE